MGTGYGAGVGLPCLPCPTPPPLSPAPQSCSSRSGCVCESTELGVCVFTHLTHMYGWYWGLARPTPNAEDGVDDECVMLLMCLREACIFSTCMFFLCCVLCVPPRITSLVGTPLPTLQPGSVNGFPPPP